MVKLIEPMYRTIYNVDGFIREMGVSVQKITNLDKIERYDLEVLVELPLDVTRRLHHRAYCEMDNIGYSFNQIKRVALKIFNDGCTTEYRGWDINSIWIEKIVCAAYSERMLEDKMNKFRDMKSFPDHCFVTTYYKNSEGRVRNELFYHWITEDPKRHNFLLLDEQKEG